MRLLLQEPGTFSVSERVRERAQGHTCMKILAWGKPFTLAFFMNKIGVIHSIFQGLMELSSHKVCQVSCTP